MALLEILEYPDPRLRTVAKPVEAVDERIRRLVDDMFETMYAAPGIGLAATQVDVHERLLENSPSLWPTMSSVMKTFMCCRPL